MNKTNLKRGIQEPFLRAKWAIQYRAKIRDAFYNIRSIKEILMHKDDIYKQLIIEGRKNMQDEKLLNELEGRIKEIEWLFGKD